MAKPPPSVFCARSMTLGAVLMLSCIYLGKYIIAPLFDDLGTPAAEQTLANVQNAIATHSIYQPDSKELLLAGSKAMVESLNDPYADFISPQQVRSFKEESTGMRIGLGLLLNSESLIVFPKPNSDAAKQGILPGDKFLEIDGEDVSSATPAEILTLLDGSSNTSVDLTMQHGDGITYRCVVKRERIPALTITDERIVDAEHGIAHLTIKSFASSTPAELDSALTRLDALGMRALILDLRFNLGGQLNDAVAVVSHFLKGDIVCHLRPQVGEEYDKYADLQLSSHPDLPLLLLVNEQSASGSEVVAAALRDHDRAVLMGTQTYGKGVFQKVLSFRDPDFVIKFSAGQYLSPNGDLIADNVGLTPDFALDKQDEIVCSSIKSWRNRIRVPQKYTKQVENLFPDYTDVAPPADAWIDAAISQMRKQMN